MKKITSFVTQRAVWLIPCGLLFATIVAYLPSLWYAFQFDDEPNILRFYAIRFKGLQDLFFTSSRWVSMWLNTMHYHFGQFQPFMYRRSNLIFHCISGVLAYYLLLNLLRLKSRESIRNRLIAIAGITMALFLLHPVQTQTVSYVVQGQLEGLSALCCLVVLVAFMWSTRLVKITHQIVAGVAIVGLCVIACGTKEITIVLPVLALLIDWFFIAQGSWTKLKTHWWLHTLITSTVMGCYLWLLGRNFFINVLALRVECASNIGNLLTQTVEQKITTWPFFISQFKVILHYLFMFIWPTICIDYDWKLCTSLNDFDCLLPLIALSALLLGIVFMLRQNRTSMYAFGLLWFLVCMAPRSSIMPATELVADYKTYLASIGWLFVLTLVLLSTYGYLQNKLSILKNRTVIWLLAILCLAGLVYATYTRNTVWCSAEEFWHDVVEKAPGKARGYNNYGVCLLARNDTKQAIWCFKKAIQQEPFTYPDPYNNLAAAYAVVDRLDLATLALKASIKINPYQPKSFNNLGVFLMKQHQFDLAEKAFQQATLLDPHYGKPYFHLGRIYLMRSDIRGAWRAFKNACTTADYDTDPQGVASYAQTSMQLCEYADAVRGFEMLLRLTPDNQRAQLGLLKARSLYAAQIRNSAPLPSAL